MPTCKVCEGQHYRPSCPFRLPWDMQLGLLAFVLACIGVSEALG